MKKSFVVIIFLALIMSTFFHVAKSKESVLLLKNKSAAFKADKITFTVTDYWFSRDKTHHFLTSAFLTTAGFYFFREQSRWSNLNSQQGAVCFSLSLGLIKEIRDGRKKTNDFSWKDLTVDILGSVLGLVIVSD